jgi:hypothetical protein
MKTFKQLFEAPGAPAQDNKPEKDTDDEVKGYKPRSKGEEDFANMHMVSKVKHPVATDAQFTGNVEKGNPEEHQGGKKQAAGETAPVKQGTSDVNAGGSEYKEPKQYSRGGEKAAVMQGSSKIKESFSSFIEERTDGND